MASWLYPVVLRCRSMAPTPCTYRNSQDRMVIVRCFGADQFYLERVVFPFEILSFAAPADAELEIWTHGLGGPELLETVPVAELTSDSSSGSAEVVGLESEDRDLLAVPA